MTRRPPASRCCASVADMAAWSPQLESSQGEVLEREAPSTSFPFVRICWRMFCACGVGVGGRGDGWTVEKDCPINHLRCSSRGVFFFFFCTLPASTSCRP